MLLSSPTPTFLHNYTAQLSEVFEYLLLFLNAWLLRSTMANRIDIITIIVVLGPCPCG